ncbi:metal-dependent transcriptional regulator [Terrisporobacter sp.]|uniref:metal-dependent transcriptional regulator n=1 Tax=Terrisporobacter sp. TaxID=1965305 RepID=UPI0026192E8B|nr:metal-dependent transcriptional regulator [Terrisporobacter sp.]
MKSQESMEDYLETILILSSKLSYVRSIDIVNEMGYSKPSVSVAMKKLKRDNLIEMDENSYIYLTNKGKIIAENIYERHNILTKALILIGVSEEVAKKDACRMEHDISEETFIKIKEFIKNNHLN